MIKSIHPHVSHSSSTTWIEQVTPPKKNPPSRESGLHHLTWSLIRRGVMMTHKLSIQGAENFPNEGPAVIVANHSSHLDTLLLGSAIPRAVRSRFSPLAAGDTFFKNPFQSWFSSRFLNLRPLWRHKTGSHSLMQLRQNLAGSDQCFLVFPEGTRTRSGDMNRFKPGIGMLVAGTRIPVIPCHIRGSFEAWPSHRKLPSKGSLHLKVGKPRTFSSHSSTTGDWRDIAHELEDDVRSLA